MTDWEYLMWLHHNSLMAGHQEPKCTLELLTRYPNSKKSLELEQKIDNYVKSCITCAWGKPMQQKPYQMLQPLLIPSRPWQDIAMGFVVKLLASRNSFKPNNPQYDLNWVVVDWFTKMACFLLYKEDTRVNILAQRFLRDIFANHGLRCSIVSDRRSFFTAKFTRALYKALDIERNLFMAFHPQTNSQTEHTNQTLEQYLKMYCSHL